MTNLKRVAVLAVGIVAWASLVSTPAEAQTSYQTLSDPQWTDLITNGGTLNNAWKARMDVIAVHLQTLKNAGVEVLFRPLHEMNQGLFWWAGRPGPNGTAKLFQITHDYLRNTKGL